MGPWSYMPLEPPELTSRSRGVAEQSRVAPGTMDGPQRSCYSACMTTTIELRLTLPDDLAREAEAGGLLEPGFLTALLREEARKRRVDGLFKAADSLAELVEPPMSAAEIEDEIDAVRKEKRQGRSDARRR